MIKRLSYSKNKRSLRHISYRYSYRTLLYNESGSKSANLFGHIIYKRAPLSISSILYKLSRISIKTEKPILLSNYHSYCSWYKNR